MAKLLLEMGLTVRDGEMNALIDAFDSDGDGSISRNEFIDFIGKGKWCIVVVVVMFYVF
jgi:Ca2+-binding EF-hand superfamily protein